MTTDVIYQGILRNTLSLEFELYWNLNRIRIKRINPQRESLNNRLYEFSKLYTRWCWHNSISRNILVEASGDGCLEIIQFLISNPSILYLYETNLMKFDWALCLAVRGGHLNVVRFLIKSGIHDLDTVSMYASEGGHLDMVKYLISEGADKIQALRSAKNYDHQEIVEYLLPLVANEKSYHFG